MSGWLLWARRFGDVVLRAGIEAALIEQDIRRRAYGAGLRMGELNAERLAICKSKSTAPA